MCCAKLGGGGKRTYGYGAAWPRFVCVCIVLGAVVPPIDGIVGSEMRMCLCVYISFYIFLLPQMKPVATIEISLKCSCAIFGF